MKSLVRTALVLLLIAGAAAGFVYRGAFDPSVLDAWLHEAGGAAPALFILLYTLGTVLFLPGAMLTLLGGALFGPLLGALYSLTGATFGAVVAFLIARYIAATPVERWLARAPEHMLSRLVDSAEAEGWRFVAFTRLVPLFPFNLLNYAFGLTRIPLRSYTVATFVCMAPGAAAFAFFGYAGRHAIAGHSGLINDGLIALALLVTLIFLPRFAARIRRPVMLDIDELKARVDARVGTVLDVRTMSDFIGDQGHIATALNVPLEDFDEQIAALELDPTQPIAIVCRTDRKSCRAADALFRKGFIHARAVRGGMTEWIKRGWPVEMMKNPEHRDATN